MESIAIKKWGPIINKLDPTNSLTEDQKVSLCNYSEDFCISAPQPESIAYGTGALGKGDNKHVYTLLPMLLKILFEVINQLAKENITVTFSNEIEPEPEMIFENNGVKFVSKSDFETRYSSINVLDKTANTLNDLGIDDYALTEKGLIQQTILNLVELGKQNGELCMHVSGNSLQLISEPTLSKSMVLTYKIKNIKK